MSRLAAVYKIPAPYLILFSLLGYILLAVWFPLIPGYDRAPVADLRSISPGLPGALLYGLVIIGLFALHVLLYHRLSSTSAPSLRPILAVTCLLALPLIFMYTINANDIYRYVARGLIRSRYGLSPFEFVPADFGEELYPLLVGEWGNAVSPYGPFWELMASTVTAVGRENLLINMLLFKVLGLLALVVSSSMLWWILASRESRPYIDPQKRAAYLSLWSWNPAVLLSFVGNAHNDAMMIAILLVGWLVVRRGFPGPGFLIMFMAALIKPIALLALPLVFVGNLREAKNLRDRLEFVLWVLIGSPLILALSFRPFGSPQSLAVRLLQEAGDGASFSPTTLLILLARHFGWMRSFDALALAGAIIFVGFFLWLLWRVWLGGTVEGRIGASFWGYILQALNFRIWYAAWPFPWSLLDAYGGSIGEKRVLHAGLWFLMTSQLSVVLYGHLRVILLAGDQLLAHLVGVPFVFLLPFILARFSAPGQDSPDVPGSGMQSHRGGSARFEADHS